MITIKSLSETTANDLYIAFKKAFEGYLRTWSKAEFEKMMNKNGYNAELSFGAFEENNLVSFTLNAIGNFNGISTAYDTGTGTIEEFRGKGLATKIFDYAVPYLKQKGAQQYLLEVLTQNAPAVSIYTKQGFKVKRELNVFQINRTEWKANPSALSIAIEFKEINFSLKKEMQSMWDFYPSWQNNFDALSRAINGFKLIGAFNKNEFIGYGIIEMETGSIPQLAVSKHNRKKGIGSAIFNELQKYNKAELIKIVNTDAVYGHVTTFIEKNGLPKFVTQYEMIKVL